MPPHDTDPTRPAADAPMVLYGHPRSGNTYKAALMLVLTGTGFEFRAVDLPRWATREAAYLPANPLGRVPTLTNGELVLRQSYDILIYLAGHDWLVAGRPTIADIACYPTARFLTDAGYSEADFPALVAWCQRVEALGGWASAETLMPV